LLFEHCVQHCPPTQTDGPAKIVDAAIIRAAAMTVGEAAVGDPLANARLRLPARMYGGGLRSIADVAAVAFVGTACRTLPRMLPRAGNDDSVVPGFMPQLMPLLGHGSFDRGAEVTRFTTFLGSETPLALALRSAWEGLQAEFD
jgi:hypothetical protein